MLSKKGRKKKNRKGKEKGVGTFQKKEKKKKTKRRVDISSQWPRRSCKVQRKVKLDRSVHFTRNAVAADIHRARTRRAAGTVLLTRPHGATRHPCRCRAQGSGVAHGRAAGMAIEQSQGPGRHGRAARSSGSVRNGCAAGTSRATSAAAVPSSGRREQMDGSVIISPEIDPACDLGRTCES